MLFISYPRQCVVFIQYKETLCSIPYMQFTCFFTGNFDLMNLKSDFPVRICDCIYFLYCNAL